VSTRLQQPAATGVQPWLARFPKDWLYYSFAAGFVALAITTNPAFSHFTVCPPGLTANVPSFLDPFLIQLTLGLQLLLIMVIALRHRLRVGELTRGGFWRRFALDVLLLAGAAAVTYVASDGLKAMFQESRPCQVLIDPPFTNWLRQTFHLTELDGTGTPSGFVVRQTWIACAALWALAQPMIRDKGGALTWGWRATHRLLASVLVLAEGLSRVLTGSHTLIDVGVAIALGVFTFWAACVIIPSLIDPRFKYAIPDITFMAIIFLPLFVLYSTRPAWWGLTIAAAFPLLCLVFLAEAPPIDALASVVGRLASNGTKGWKRVRAAISGLSV
jgi:hypothetical protein